MKSFLHAGFIFSVSLMAVVASIQLLDGPDVRAKVAPDVGCLAIVRYEVDGSQTVLPCPEDKEELHRYQWDWVAPDWKPPVPQQEQ